MCALFAGDRSPANSTTSTIGKTATAYPPEFDAAAPGFLKLLAHQAPTGDGRIRPVSVNRRCSQPDIRTSVSLAFRTFVRRSRASRGRPLRTSKPMAFDVRCRKGRRRWRRRAAGLRPAASAGHPPAHSYDRCSRVPSFNRAATVQQSLQRLCYRHLEGNPHDRRLSDYMQWAESFIGAANRRLHLT